MSTTATSRPSTTARRWTPVLAATSASSPRVYFEDSTASAPVDNDAEARGLAHWARLATGRAVDPGGVPVLLAPRPRS
jgi:hypothetical protein